MTQKGDLFKGQKKKKVIPPNRHGKVSHTRKGKRVMNPSNVTNDMKANRHTSLRFLFIPAWAFRWRTVFYRERLAANHHTSGSISDEQTTPIAFSSIDRQISLFLSSDRSIWSDASDAAAFLEAVDALVASLRGHNSSPAVNRADNLLQQCMLLLEDEFRSMIEHPFDFSQFDPVPPPDLDSVLQRRRGITLSSQSKELSKFINQCNEIKAANMASKEGSQLSIIKTEEDASNSSKK